ncbi:oxygen-dependent tRNA uridine(34) hydroxylase TrhO [Paracoccus beibuensis]|uniref:oxygen-dependent tRNA uridine(34) hydroxylase TrhO n=1 Tax=Paracoccus beibuensis TaxID=547602 RepID=UPI00223F9296|nr:rhodanese-related sulfurtransferase [Paracoccus beibuensis]
MLTVAALYHFARLPDPAVRQAPLLDLCRAGGLCGTLLLAPEGINGTVAGPREGILAVLGHIRAWPGFHGLDWKESAATTPPFGRMKVRLKREIVTMGQPDVDPTAAVGRYVAAADWNALVAAPDVAVIDTRNDYEVQVGTFQGAIDPGTKSFSEFPAWWADNADRFRGKRIAMFCTGGIRCEKATNFLISQGVDDVCHLQGGILKYLEEVPEADSTWQGECFVFDQRVSLTHGLAQGRHGMCHACRRPLAPEDRDRAEYEEGVCCHRCATEYTDADRARFRDRQRQFDRDA